MTDIREDDALSRYAASGSVGERQQILTSLMRAKLIPKQADDPRFRRGFENTLEDAANGALGPEDRLVAIAEVVRVAQVVKRLQGTLANVLKPAFERELPSLALLKEADDRLNVARACNLFDHDWLAGFLARSVAEEEQGENARAELVGALLRVSDTIASMLIGIAEPMSTLRPATETPSDTVARRLTRTLASLRAVIPSSELEAGTDVGQALHQLVAGPLRGVGRPRDEKVQQDLAREVMLLTHEILRTRFSVATEPAMFQAVTYCRQILGGSTWPDALRDVLSLLVKDVREALILLGRQGVRDQLLLNQLEVLCNFPERARAIARELAERHPELDEETRGWLMHGKSITRRESNATAVEATARDADEAIGLALSTAVETRRAIDGVRDSLIATLDIYEQGLVAVTGDCFRRMDALVLQVEQAARQRGLSLYGSPGEEIDFSPKFFRQIGEIERQRVVVRQPSIVRLRKDGTPGEVVLKGLVE